MRHPDERPDGTGWAGAGHPDEGTIHAWLDGALEPGGAAALERHLAGCEACVAAVAEARGLIAASSRILSRLDEVPGGVLPGAPGAPAAPAADAARAASAGLADRPAGASGGDTEGGAGVVPLASRRPAPTPLWRRGAVRALAAVALLAVGVTAVLRETEGDRSISELTSAEEAAPVADRAAGAPGAAPMAAGVADSAPDSSYVVGLVASSTAESAVGARAARGDPGDPGAAESPRPGGRPPAETARERAPEPARPAPAVSRAAPDTSRPRVEMQQKIAAVADAAADAATRPDAVQRGIAGGIAAAPPPPAPVPAPAPARPTASAREAAPMPAGSTSTVRPFRAPADSAAALARRRVLPPTVEPDSVPASPADSAQRRAAAGRAVAGAPTAPSGAPARAVPDAVERFAGCYRISVSGEAGEARDRIEGVLPGWLELGPTPRPTAGWYVAGSAADDRDIEARWRVNGGLVTVEWPVDDQLLDLRLRPWAEGLAGTAAWRTAGERGEDVSVLARRVGCGGE